MDNEAKVLPIDDFVEVVKKQDNDTIENEIKADGTEAKEPTKTDVVDSAEVEVKPKGEGETDIIVDDELKGDDIVDLEHAIKDKDNEPTGELIESDVVEDEDKKRDKFLAEAQDICDSADFGLNVKMPYQQGRESYRSVVFHFAKANPQFLDKKYSNLRLDSFTNELCDEVKNDMFSKIKSHKPKPIQQKHIFVDTGKGYRVMSDF